MKRRKPNYLKGILNRMDEVKLLLCRIERQLRADEDRTIDTLIDSLKRNAELLKASAIREKELLGMRYEKPLEGRLRAIESYLEAKGLKEECELAISESINVDLRRRTTSR